MSVCKPIVCASYPMANLSKMQHPTHIKTPQFAPYRFAALTRFIWHSLWSSFVTISVRNLRNCQRPASPAIAIARHPLHRRRLRGMGLNHFDTCSCMFRTVMVANED